MYLLKSGRDEGEGGLVGPVGPGCPSVFETGSQTKTLMDHRNTLQERRGRPGATPQLQRKVDIDQLPKRFGLISSSQSDTPHPARWQRRAPRASPRRPSAFVVPSPTYPAGVKAYVCPTSSKRSSASSRVVLPLSQARSLPCSLRPPPHPASTSPRAGCGFGRLRLFAMHLRGPSE